MRTTLGGDASFLIGRALGLMGVIRPAQRGDAAPEFLLCTSENGQMRARRAGTKCNPTDSTHAQIMHCGHRSPKGGASRYGAHFASLAPNTVYTVTVHDPSGSFSTT